MGQVLGCSVLLDPVLVKDGSAHGEAAQRMCRAAWRLELCGRQPETEWEGPVSKNRAKRKLKPAWKAWKTQLDKGFEPVGWVREPT